MRIFQEEIFGPFITVTPFSDEPDVVAMANGVPFGLGAGLWTQDLRRAHKVAAKIKAGMVSVNAYKLVDPRLHSAGTR